MGFLFVHVVTLLYATWPMLGSELVLDIAMDFHYKLQQIFSINCGCILDAEDMLAVISITLKCAIMQFVQKPLAILLSIEFNKMVQ